MRDGIRRSETQRREGKFIYHFRSRCRSEDNIKKDLNVERWDIIDLFGLQWRVVVCCGGHRNECPISINYLNILTGCADVIFSSKALLFCFNYGLWKTLFLLDERIFREY